MEITYPYYLHNNEEFVNYWKKYFEEYPVTDDNTVEIYVDFPFCRSICKFCVFGSYTIGEYKDKIQMYENSMIQLVKDMKDVFPKRINNVYFGGGSPTLWSPQTLREIISNIPSYNNALLRQFEVHPFDINDELIDFLIHDMNIKTISIGIQSFDERSLKEQHRLPCNIETLKRAVKIFHDHGMYVNIDIVALFNEDSENGWDIFREDLRIVADEIKPDDICSSVNFRCKDYYGKSMRYRKLLNEFLDSHPEYIPATENMLSLDFDDLIRYEEEVYHIRTPEYQYFYSACNPGVIDRNIYSAKNNIVIALGGNEKHHGIGRAGAKLEELNSKYNFNRKVFVHQVHPIKVSSPNDPPSRNLKVGTQWLDTSINI